MADASLCLHDLPRITFDEYTHPMLSHINVGTGTEVTIRELDETVNEVVGFRGEIIFDSTKPDGTPRKLMEVSLLAKFGWTASMPLKSGLVRSYADFRSALRGEI